MIVTGKCIVILDSSLTGCTKVSPFLLPNVSWIHCTFSINTAFILILILDNPILNYGKPSSTLFCRELVDFHPIFLVHVSVLAQWESFIECIKYKLPQAALFLSPPMCLSKGTLPSKHFSCFTKKKKKLKKNLPWTSTTQLLFRQPTPPLSQVCHACSISTSWNAWSSVIDQFYKPLGKTNSQSQIPLPSPTCLDRTFILLNWLASYYSVPINHVPFQMLGKIREKIEDMGTMSERRLGPMEN